MAKPYVTELKFPNGLELTSIVIDEPEFMALVDELEGLELKGPDGKPGQLDSIKKAKHIPLIYKGTKIAFIFDRYGVKTDKCAVITRGQGKKIAKKMFPDPERN